MDPVKIGGGSGGVAGLLAVYISGRFGWHLTATDGAAILAASVALIASLVHNGGLVGVARLLFRGLVKSTPAA